MDPLAIYFHEAADVADDLFTNGRRSEAFLVATVALDALAEIWRHDFKVAHQPGALHFADFVASFAGDPDASLICVVFLAQDMITDGPSRLHTVAERLLDGRAAAPGGAPRHMEFRESPHAYRDVAWPELVKEEPSLATEHDLQKASRHYTRAAIAYRLYRCGYAHTFSKGTRATGFSSPVGDDEISYFPAHRIGKNVRPISLKIGIRTFSRWLRAAATNYTAACAAAGKRPADKLDASERALELLRREMRKVS